MVLDDSPPPSTLYAVLTGVNRSFVEGPGKLAVCYRSAYLNIDKKITNNKTCFLEP